MICDRRIVDPKKNRHHIEKFPGIDRAHRGKVAGCVKKQSVMPGDEKITAKHRLVGPAIAVGESIRQRDFLSRFQPMQFDPHAGSGFAGGGVEHMGGEFSDHVCRSTLAKMSP
jgi:hypothetical protein